MSFQLMAWAAEQKTGSGVDKAVLMALANRANHDTGLCCPRIETLVEETEFGRTAVKNALVRLVEGGFVSRERGRNSDGSLGVYYYSFEGSRDGLPGAGDDPRPEPRDDPRNQEVEPSTRVETSNEVSTVGERAREAANVQTVYDVWRAERGKSRATYARISPARRTKIEMRLREFSADELCEAIRGVGRDPWADRHLHDDLTVIFRSREQVEKFLELAAGRGTNGNSALSALPIAEAALRRARGAPQ